MQNLLMSWRTNAGPKPEELGMWNHDPRGIQRKPAEYPSILNSVWWKLGQVANYPIGTGFIIDVLMYSCHITFPIMYFLTSDILAF
jgi:hypothetical protein